MRTAYTPTAPDDRPRGGAGQLDVLLGERLQFLDRVLAQIEQELVERKALSAQVLGWLWEDYLALRAELLPLLERPFLLDRSFDPRRATLDDRLDRLRLEARQESAQRWRDEGQLRRERREWLRLRNELRERAQLLGAAGGATSKGGADGKDKVYMSAEHAPLTGVRRNEQRVTGTGDFGPARADRERDRGDQRPIPARWGPGSA